MMTLRCHAPLPSEPQGQSPHLELRGSSPSKKRSAAASLMTAAASSSTPPLLFSCAPKCQAWCAELSRAAVQGARLRAGGATQAVLTRCHRARVPTVLLQLLSLSVSPLWLVHMAHAHGVCTQHSTCTCRMQHMHAARTQHVHMA